MGKRRERENPCEICGHYHKYEEGEPCGVCGHRLSFESSSPAFHVSAFASEILPGFLFLGTYDNAARRELLLSQGISHVLNTVATSQNLHRNLFTYHTLQDQDKRLPIDDAVQFLEQCKSDNARVLVHCMTGRNRSPAVVIAYLMKSNGWKLAESYQWVKERKPSVELTQAVYEQLQQYEQQIFGSTDSSTTSPSFPSPALSIRPNDQPVPVPAFSNGGSSLLSGPPVDNPQEITFGASKN